MSELNPQKENVPIPVGSYRYIIVRPGGNDTALINGLVQDPIKRKFINDEVMKLYPNVEQVGFTESNPEFGTIDLIMAGGEFCGNATRSAALLALKGKSGEVKAKVSGVSEPLVAGVSESGRAYAQMPIYKDPSKITDDNGSYVVEMEGITQYVTFDTEAIKGLAEEEVKQYALGILRSRGLTKGPAAGVMFAEKSKDTYKLTPIVYVRDIDTLFLETACGSGTTAFGMVLAKQQGASITQTVIQPSGQSISVSVEFGGEGFGKAFISGQAEVLNVGTLEVGERLTYVIELIDTLQKLEQVFSGGLTPLYQDIFGKPPYNEQFTEQEVRDTFKEYVDEGVLFAARNQEGVIGFGAAMPLLSKGELANLAYQFGFTPSKTMYMADLGVKDEFRNNKIGKRLVEERLRLFGRGDTVIMRTSVNNIASQSLYRSLGFQIVEGMTQQVEQTRIDGTTQVDTRLFMYKELP